MGAGASSPSLSSYGNNRRAHGKKAVRCFREKTGQLQEEIAAIAKERERESKSYRRDAMAFATREAEWRKERRKLREELRRLRSMEECTEDRSRQLEMMVLGERMREERARRDEAAERWKQLYLAIKTELDDLIQTACCGFKAGEEEAATAEELKKEATITSLRSQVACLEQEKVKLQREIDILRQSLRIISSTATKPANTTKNRGYPEHKYKTPGDFGISV
ncbi:hypothetical protein MLD38_027218 [Melastoma candidum]|uniref:Uncharacterized protein n=1 Tax=Melastoma candidum TaxID=119954 RepID=A0ACB9P125_9MYRT|nr:hypothetical protein MLD38_027218 [Melastoma candidum]